MKPEEAIKTAIEFEQKVHRTYHDAVAAAKDSTARRFFELMATEERSHIDYLEHKLARWTSDGVLDADDLETALPSPARLAQGLAKLKEGWGRSAKSATPGTELAALKQALEAEGATLAFYRRMVEELPGEYRKLFARFLDIEEGHRAAVAAEIDAVESFGFWFDMQEFDQELGV